MQLKVRIGTKQTAANCMAKETHLPTPWIAPRVMCIQIKLSLLHLIRHNNNNRIIKMLCAENLFSRTRLDHCIVKWPSLVPDGCLTTTLPSVDQTNLIFKVFIIQTNFRSIPCDKNFRRRSTKVYKLFAPLMCLSERTLTSTFAQSVVSLPHGANNPSINISSSSTSVRLRVFMVRKYVTIGEGRAGCVLWTLCESWAKFARKYCAIVKGAQRLLDCRSGKVEILCRQILVEHVFWKKV